MAKDRPTLLNNSQTSFQSAQKIDFSYSRVSWFSNSDACDAGRVWERPPQPWQRPRPPGVQLPQQFTFTSFCICICICVQEFSWFCYRDLPSLHCLCILLYMYSSWPSPYSLCCHLTISHFCISNCICVKGFICWYCRSLLLPHSIFPLTTMCTSFSEAQKPKTFRIETFFAQKISGWSARNRFSPQT